MAWQPLPGPLGQLAQYLRDSLSGHDVAAQRNAEQMLRHAKASPDINNYLAFLSVTSTEVTTLKGPSWHATRSAAAIMLKNNVKTSYRTIPDSNKAYVKSIILAGLQDPNVQIRNYVGNVITEVVRQGGVLGWPQVLSQLIATVTNENGQSSAEAQDGAMSALFKICEDNRRALDKDHQQERPLAFLLPRFLELTNNASPKIRSRALASINIFLDSPIALSVGEHISQILSQIIRLTTDPSEDVRRFVCRAFALLASSVPNVLLPHMEGIVDYTLSQQSDVQKEELALDAAEFFFEASSNETLRDALGPYLGKIVPVLLDCMVYGEDDQLRLEGDAEDADLEDEDKDIKPHFATSKTSRSATTTSMTTEPTNGQRKPAANGYAYENDDEDLSDGEIEDDEDDLELNPEDEWNLRKCSATVLDSIASHFGGRVFDVTLPWLTRNLQHQDWPNREAAVLALGAIGPGCMDNIEPHLSMLVPYMITLLTDQQPVVRQITCWALSRFANWASHLDLAGKKSYFEPMMDGILQRMLDGNKNVQESAASAFATLEEAANEELRPYCDVIVQQFVKCFSRYQDRNMYMLYDCVQTLAEYAGPQLARDDIVQLLMPALITRWEKVQDQSREMFPLLECLAFVAGALNSKLTPFAKPFWDRCIRILHQNLEDGVTAESSTRLDQPDKDFLVTSLDLLSAILQSLEEKYSTELAATTQPNLFQVLAYCMKDSSNDVRQSAYALLGDCAIYIFPQLQHYLPTLMQLVIAQLDLSQARDDPDTAFRVINNACWSCGEISMRAKEAMVPYVEQLLTKLAVIMFSSEVPQSLNENAAIALGRLGIGCHRELAPHLDKFALPFLHAMKKVAWTDEKGHAYKGFVKIVLDNPQALEHCLLDFFTEMANAPGLMLTGMQDEGPLQGFERVLAQYKLLIGAGWDAYLAHLPPTQEQALRRLYTF